MADNILYVGGFFGKFLDGEECAIVATLWTKFSGFILLSSARSYELLFSLSDAKNTLPIHNKLSKNDQPMEVYAN